MTTLRKRNLRRLAFAAVLAWAVAPFGGEAAAQVHGNPVTTDPTVSQLPAMQQVLAKYDLDHDGKLNPTEKAAFQRDFVQKLEPMRRQALRQYDWNHDGKISGAEREAMRTARETQHARAETRALARYDADRDGKLSAVEQAARTAAREAWLARKREQTLQVFDANRNGVLDPEEKSVIRKKVESSRQAALDMYDANRDGRLDAAERSAAAEPVDVRKSPRSAGAVNTRSASMAAATGGELQTGSGEARLAIPAEALSADAKVSLTAEAARGDGYEAGRRVLRSVTVSLAGASLRKPATLDLSFATVTAVSPGRLGIARWNGDRWEDAGGEVAIGSRRVSAAVTQPGRYALVERSSGSSGPAMLANLRVSPVGGRSYREGVDIAFVLAGAGGVSVKVYDTSGRLMRSVVAREPMTAGEQVVRWDGRGSDGRAVANGLYLVQVEGPVNHLTRKVPFIR